MNGNKLELIGAGVRKKYNVISVYSLGMYVDPKKKGEMAKKGSLSVLSSPSKGSTRAGQVNTALFDKTGTITTDALLADGVSTIIQEDEEGDARVTHYESLSHAPLPAQRVAAYSARILLSECNTGKDFSSWSRPSPDAAETLVSTFFRPL